jgi:hypothetical protein
VSALNKAKGFKKSKSGTYLSIAGTAFGATRQPCSCSGSTRS